MSQNETIRPDELGIPKEQIEDLRSQAMDILEEVKSIGDQVTYDRAVRGWSAEIEMALSNDHQWVGSLEMDTLEETIDCCEALNQEDDYKDWN